MLTTTRTSLVKRFLRFQCALVYGHSMVDGACRTCGATELDVALSEVEGWLPSPRFEDEDDDIGYYWPIRRYE